MLVSRVCLHSDSVCVCAHHTLRTRLHKITTVICIASTATSKQILRKSPVVDALLAMKPAELSSRAYMCAHIHRYMQIAARSCHA